MSDKNVDYTSIVVNFNTIMQKLNAVALDFAEKKNPEIKVENLAFEDAEDPKKGKFIGGGQYRIVGGMKDQSKEVLPKKDFADVFVEYTSWFCGKEEASYIKEQMLQPIYKSEDLSSDQNDSQKQEPSGNSEENKEKDKEKEKTVSESFYTEQENSLLNMLFEAEEGKKPEENSKKEAEKKEKDGEKAEDPSEKKENGEKKSNQKLIGYSIGYDITVNNKKDRGLKDWAKHKSRGLFGGVLADLRNITITLNGQKFLNVGKLFDPDKWKDAFGFIDIDKNRVASNVKNAIDHDFENNDADVRCMSGKTLVTYLNRKGKLTPQIQSKIQNAKYSVVISVNQNDPNYPDYNQKDIAKSASKGFGTTDRMIDHNKVEEKDVIKIDNIESLYKRHSSYDKELKIDVRDRASDGKLPTVSSTSSTAKATQSEKVPTRSTVTEKEAEKKEEEQNKPEEKKEVSVKEDTELEKLVKSDEYKSFVSKKLEEQCNLELKDDEHTCKYGSTEDITNDMMQKGVNDLELLRKIKNKGEQSYYLTVTQNLQQSVNETISREKNLLKILFEDVMEAEDIIEENDDRATEETLEASTARVNITGDPERDEQSKQRMKSGIKNILRFDKVEKAVKNRCERVIKNTIIKTLDQFKTDRTFEELDIDFSMTSVEKGSLEESILDAVRKYLDLIDESITLEVEDEKKITPEVLKEIEYLIDVLMGSLHRVQKAESKKLQLDPYCAISSSDRVAEYLKKHNLCDEKTRSEIMKKPYCGIVVAKRDLEVDGRTVEGGRGHTALTDSAVNSVLDEVCGSKNKIPVINCKNQSRDMMDEVEGDLIASRLSFHSESKSKSPNFIRNPQERHVPELDIWLRPFELDESVLRRQHPSPEPTPDPSPDPKPGKKPGEKPGKKPGKKTSPGNKPSPSPIPGPTSIVQWFIVLPDPIPVVKPEKKDKTDDKEPTDNDPNKQTDWYIIPHKRIKDMGDRPHQETHYKDGVTSTKTSDDEYKP